MSWMKPYKGKWSSKAVDRAKFKEQLKIIYNCAKPMHNVDENARSVVFYTQQLERDIDTDDILIDMDYGELFDGVQKLHMDKSYDIMMAALEELYIVADIGTAAEDTIKRRAREYKWMVTKGYTNDSNT